MEWKIEKAAESVIGAKVEIDKLKYYFKGPGISFKRLQVANPYNPSENLFETGPLGFYIEPAPLLKKKLIIQQIKINQLRFGTARKRDGRISNKGIKETTWLKKVTQSLQSQFTSKNVFNFDVNIDLDSLVVVHPVRSLKHLAEIKAAADSLFKHWQAQKDEFLINTDNSEPETDHSMGLTADRARSDESGQSSQQLQKRHGTPTEFSRKKAKAKRSYFRLAYSSLIERLDKVDEWIEEDSNRLIKKTNFHASPRSIGKTIFGEPLARTLIQLLTLVALSREHMPVTNGPVTVRKEANFARSGGRDIHFSSRHSLPDFLINRISIHVQPTQPDTTPERGYVRKVQGDILGVTSQPGMSGHPLTFEIEVLFSNPKTYNLSGLIDHTAEPPRESFQFLSTGRELASIDLPKSSCLPDKIFINNGNMGAMIQLKGDYLEFTFGISATDGRFEITDNAANKNELAQSILDTLKSLNRFYLKVDGEGPITNINWRVISNISKIIADRIQEVRGKSLDSLHAQLHQKLKENVAAQKHKTEAVLHCQLKEISAEISDTFSLDQKEQLLQK